MSVAIDITHLFTAVYEDGSSFSQTVADRSVMREGGSAFSDVDHSRLIAFIVEGGQNDKDETNLYEVDLRTGSFRINGVEVLIGDDDEPVVFPLKLVYFRRVRQIQQTDMRTRKVLGRSMTRYYCIGWESADGKVKRTIAFGHEVFQVN